MNGTIIQPGQEFSFNDTVGERTEAKGYQSAAAYNNTNLSLDASYLEIEPFFADLFQRAAAAAAWAFIAPNYQLLAIAGIILVLAIGAVVYGMQHSKKTNIEPQSSENKDNHRHNDAGCHQRRHQRINILHSQPLQKTLEGAAGSFDRGVSGQGNDIARQESNAQIKRVDSGCKVFRGETVLSGKGIFSYNGLSTAYLCSQSDYDKGKVRVVDCDKGDRDHSPVLPGPPQGAQELYFPEIRAPAGQLQSKRAPTAEYILKAGRPLKKQWK